MPTSAGPREAFTLSTSFVNAPIAGDVALGAAVGGSLNDDQPAEVWRLRVDAGTTLDFALEGMDDFDPFLIVLDSKGRELARNDDVDFNAGDYDSAVRALTLPAGQYFVIAGRYGQRSSSGQGDYRLMITLNAGAPAFGTFSQLLTYNTAVDGTITNGDPEDTWTFRGLAGDRVALTMAQTLGNLDPSLSLTDNLGNTLIVNEDDLRADSTNSTIEEYILPYDGYYTIIATRFASATPLTTGSYRLTLTQTRAAQRGEVYPLYAAPDTINTRSLRADNQYFVNLLVGDVLVDNDNGTQTEQRLQLLLSFMLPELPDGRSVESASLQLEPCIETGGGFLTQGPLTVMLENYGVLSGRNIQRSGTGARILSEQSSCNAVDITSAVQSAYASSTNRRMQFRLSFRSSPLNGQGDLILVTPRLIVQPTS
jgi:hypothetical protein